MQTGLGFLSASFRSALDSSTLFENNGIRCALKASFNRRMPYGAGGKGRQGQQRTLMRTMGMAKWECRSQMECQDAEVVIWHE